MSREEVLALVHQMLSDAAQFNAAFAIPVAITLLAASIVGGASQLSDWFQNSYIEEGEQS